MNCIELQSKLLRVLEEGSFERLGSTKTLKVDVRVIASTNRDLEQATKDGNFRKDLFYRLSVFPIVIPPLRERPAEPALRRPGLPGAAARAGPLFISSEILTGSPSENPPEN